MTPALNIKAAATSLVGVKLARAPVAPPPIPPDTSLALSDLVPAGHGPIVVPVAVLPIATTSNATQPPSVKASVNTIGKRSQITTFTIPAGQTFPLSAYGNRFQILQATCPVPVRYDNTAGFSTYSPGLGLAICTETDFSLLEFQNPLNLTITVTVFFGWDEPSAFIAPVLPTGTFSYEVGIFSTGVPQLLVPAASPAFPHLYFRKGFFYGLLPANSTGSQNTNTNNTGAVNIGFLSATNINGAAGTAFMPDVINPGSWVEYEAPAGESLDLDTMWIVGTQNDRVWALLYP